MNVENFSPTFNVEDITPEYAQKILEYKNSNNRIVRKANLNKLVQSINSDEWQITNQGIAFDCEGNLLDGQHRLMAIVKTGKTLKMMVARNMDAKIFNVVDTGTARMASDILHIGGCSHNSKQIAAAIKVYLFYKKYPSGSWTHCIKSTHNEIFACYKQNELSWNNINIFISSSYRKFAFFNKGVGIAFYKLLLDKGYSTEVIESFYTKFSQGSNLDVDDPMLSFRNQLMQKAFRNRGSSTQRFLLNCFIRLFNMHMKGTKKTRFMAPPPDISNVLEIQDFLPNQSW